MRARCKKKAARLLLISGPLRLSRLLRQQEPAADPEAVPLRRALVWVLVGAVLVVGLVLYFKYERLVVPLLG